MRSSPQINALIAFLESGPKTSSEIIAHVYGKENIHTRQNFHQLVSRARKLGRKLQKDAGNKWGCLDDQN